MYGSCPKGKGMRHRGRTFDNSLESALSEWNAYEGSCHNRLVKFVGERRIAEEWKRYDWDHFDGEFPQFFIEQVFHDCIVALSCFSVRILTRTPRNRSASSSRKDVSPSPGNSSPSSGMRP